MLSPVGGATARNKAQAQGNQSRAPSGAECPPNAQPAAGSYGRRVKVSAVTFRNARSVWCTRLAAVSCRSASCCTASEQQLCAHVCEQVRVKESRSEGVKAPVSERCICERAPACTLVHECAGEWLTLMMRLPAPWNHPQVVTRGAGVGKE